MNQGGKCESRSLVGVNMSQEANFFVSSSWIHCDFTPRCAKNSSEEAGTFVDGSSSNKRRAFLLPLTWGYVLSTLFPLLFFFIVPVQTKESNSIGCDTLNNWEHVDIVKVVWKVGSCKANSSIMSRQILSSFKLVSMLSYDWEREVG